MESSDQDGKETQVSFKTFEGEQESWSVFKEITPDHLQDLSADGTT